LPQLKTSLLVQSAMVRANRDLVSMVLIRRGDADNGAVLVRLDLPDGRAVVERRVLNFDGDYEWSAASGDTPLNLDEAEAFCKRELDIDPDCWIVAIDSAVGDNPLRDL
jgi:hypothetical protein